MPLIRPHSIKERILLFGPEGSGKSVCPFSIAQICELNNYNARFYIIDDDGESAERTRFMLYPTLTNLDITEVHNWENLTAAVSRVKSLAQPHDFLIVDLLCRTWDFVQDYFTRQVFGKSQDEYFMDARKRIQQSTKKEAPGALEGFRDWQYIKQLYKAFLNDILFEAFCNVICTSLPSLLDEKMDDKDSKNLYSRIGFKPAGQKKIGAAFHTVMYVNSFSGEHYITTVKDRCRTHLSCQLTHFGIQYLIGVCGWKVV